MTRCCSYFKKSEHYEPGGDDTRGRGGPLNVAAMREHAELTDAFIEAAVAQGYPRNPDYNNGEQQGFGYYQVTQKDGRRWSTARAFLDPARRRPNLRVETEALASRILLDGKRAVGVAYTQRGQRQEARCGARGDLAAGAVKSPHLLELSGIGQPEVLQSAGIEVQHELRGVGENYRDHYAPRMNWRVKLPVTLNEQTRGVGVDEGGAEILHAASRRADLHRRHRLWLCEDAAGVGGARRAVSFRPCQLRQRRRPGCWSRSRG